MEVWKQIAPGYEVSTLGRVRSCWNGVTRILSPNLTGHGYLNVSININGKSFFRRVHRLVAQAFISNPEGKREINHINGIKTDNRVENLEWCTRSENMLHAFATGLKSGMNGEENPFSKLTNAQAEEIRDNPDRLSDIELAEKFGVATRTIRNIQRGRTYKNAGGHIRKPRKSRVPDDVRAQIRHLYETGGQSQRKLAAMFGIGHNTIFTIIHEVDNLSLSS